MTTNDAASTLTDPADLPRTTDLGSLGERIFEAAVASLRTLSIDIRRRPELYRGVTAPDEVAAPDNVTADELPPSHALRPGMPSSGSGSGGSPAA